MRDWVLIPLFYGSLAGADLASDRMAQRAPGYYETASFGVKSNTGKVGVKVVQVAGLSLLDHWARKRDKRWLAWAIRGASAAYTVHVVTGNFRVSKGGGR